MSGSGPGTSGSNATNPVAAAIDSVIALGAAAVSASAPGAAYVWVPGASFPTVPSGQYGSVSITGTVSGTAILPVPYSLVTDDATGTVTIIASGTTPQVASIPASGQTYAARGGAGFFVSGNLQAQASPTGTGAGGTASPTGTGVGAGGTASPTGTGVGAGGTPLGGGSGNTVGGNQNTGTGSSASAGMPATVANGGSPFTPVAAQVTGTGQGGNLWRIGASGTTASYLASDGRADTIIASQGSNWIATGQNSSDRIWIDGGTAAIATRGADTIGIGAAEATVVGSGDGLVFAGGSKTLVDAIAGAETVIGGTTAVTVTGSDSASLLAYGGSAGGNLMLNNGTAATLVGGGTGDRLVGLAGQNVLVASSGNETLFGGDAAKNTVFIGGNGTDVMAAQNGGNIFVAGTGTDQVLAAGTANAFDFRMGMAGGTMIVLGFDGTDTINLSGYAPDAATTAFHGAQLSGGNTVVTLADNTKIMLLGFTGLTQSNVVA
jgi:hypothetical protein